MFNTLNKTIAAIITGIVIWVAGSAMIALFGQAANFSSAVIPAAFLAAPMMYLITMFHLRDILPAIMLALEIGYFWLLVVPFWMEKPT